MSIQQPTTSKLEVEILSYIGKYFVSNNDFINMMKVSKKYKSLVSLYKYNPIDDYRLFANMEEQHVYSNEFNQKRRRGMKKYIQWKKQWDKNKKDAKNEEVKRYSFKLLNISNELIISIYEIRVFNEFLEANTIASLSTNQLFSIIETSQLKMMIPVRVGNITSLYCPLCDCIKKNSRHIERHELDIEAKLNEWRTILFIDAIELVKHAYKKYLQRDEEERIRMKKKEDNCFYVTPKVKEYLESNNINIDVKLIEEDVIGQVSNNEEYEEETEENEQEQSEEESEEDNIIKEEERISRKYSKEQIQFAISMAIIVYNDFEGINEKCEELRELERPDAIKTINLFIDLLIFSRRMSKEDIRIIDNLIRVILGSLTDEDSLYDQLSIKYNSSVYRNKFFEKYLLLEFHECSKDCIAFCLSLDGTSEDKEERYCVIVYFTFRDCTKKEYLLCLKTIKDSQRKAINLEAFVEDQLVNKGVSVSKCSALVCDGASNLSSDDNGVRGIMSKKAFKDDRLFVYNYCDCHSLDLCIKTFMEKIPAVTDYISFFTSAEIKGKLREFCKKKDMKMNPSISNTRWCYCFNSVNYHVEYFFFVVEFINKKDVDTSKLLENTNFSSVTKKVAL